jgi:preprotein translocase subunit YajC
VAIFFLIVLLAVVGWVTLVMPARRRRSSHAEMQDSVEVGDEVITAGGIHAFVREIDEDVIRAEIAEGVVVTLDRRAVAAVAREIEVEVRADPAPKDAA